MELVNLSARGTIIQVPLEIIKRSDIIRDWYEKQKSSSFYMNYSPDVVHKFIDYLTDKCALNGYLNDFPEGRKIIFFEGISYDILTKMKEEYKIDGYTVKDTVTKLLDEIVVDDMQYYMLYTVPTSRYDIVKKIWKSLYDPLKHSKEQIINYGLIPCSKYKITNITRDTSDITSFQICIYHNAITIFKKLEASYGRHKITAENIDQYLRQVPKKIIAEVQKCFLPCLNENINTTKVDKIKIDKISLVDL
jgi:hypothetical protein